MAKWTILTIACIMVLRNSMVNGGATFILCHFLLKIAILLHTEGFYVYRIFASFNPPAACLTPFSKQN